jgi:eukaryotic-like serine/threonine-protein kinase
MTTEPLSKEQRCRTCGAVLPYGKLEGQCAVCLMKTIFQPDEEEEDPYEGRTFASYELHEELGRGGMGVVYRAWQPSLQRIVALKLLLGGAFSSREAVSRFKKEAQIAAGLRHPHLVPIYEADEAEGQPYYVMEFIEGESLSELTRGTPLVGEKAARYLLATARAVEYAHSQGVLHRDLKPSNILIDAFDQPRVADFGLARSQHEVLDLTVSGETLGSPAFMAPELASGRKNQSSPSSDLYALGGVLYQALTGRPPFQGESIVQILEQAKNAAPISPRQLVPGIPVDLETVCLKCLEKEPAQRYPSVAAFADDLARFLCGDLVQARPVSGWVKLWRWMRLRPALSLSLLALLLSLFVGTGLVLRKARENQVQARSIRELSYDVRSEAYANGINAAVTAWREGDYSMAKKLLVKNPGPADPEFREFAARWLAEEIKDPSLAVLHGHRSMTLTTKFSHDGRWLATGGQGAVCQIWDVAARRLHREWALPGQVYSIDFSPDDQRLYLGTGELRQPTGVSVWNLESGAKLDEFPGNMGSLSSDGTRLATVEAGFYPYWTSAGSVRIWDVSTRQLLAEWPGEFRRAAISPDGQSVAMAAKTGELTLADIATRQSREIGKVAGVSRGLCFSPDARWLAAWSFVEADSPDAVIIDTHQQQAPVMIPHPRQLMALTFSPDSSHFMTASSDYAVRRWSCAGKEDESARLLGSKDEVWSLDFHPTEPLLATGDKLGDITFWSTLATPAPPAVLPHFAFERPEVSVDGKYIATRESAVACSVRDIASGEILYRLPNDFFPLHIGEKAEVVIAFSPVTSRIIWWDTASSTEVKSYPCPALQNITHAHWLLRVAADAQTWLVMDSPTSIALRRSKDGSLITSWNVPKMKGQMEREGHLALSREAGLAASCPCGSNTVWLLRPGQSAVALEGHRLAITRLEFSPDGKTLATASLDHEIRLWEVATGRCVKILPGHFEEVSDISFSPDSRTLASIAYGDSVKIWQLPIGRELLRLDDPQWGGNLIFSPDGRRIFASHGRREQYGPNLVIKILYAP